MTPDALMRIVAGVALINLLWFVRIGAQLGFYRGYFNEKQRLAGKDPHTSIRGEFPPLVYYLVFWRPL